MPDEPVTQRRYEDTIDGHRTRCEVRLIQGEWSAYVFVDPVTTDGVESPGSAREALAKAMRAAADDFESALDGE